jgi:isopentenyl phosphate kinase
MANKAISEMVAEALREIGVLAIALTPIDMIFQHGPIRWSVIAYALSVGFLFLILGILLERMRT